MDKEPLVQIPAGSFGERYAVCVWWVVCGVRALLCVCETLCAWSVASLFDFYDGLFFLLSVRLQTSRMLFFCFFKTQYRVPDRLDNDFCR